MAWRVFQPKRGLPWLAAGILITSAAAPSAAQARGFVGFGFSVPLIAGPPPVYYPPPAYHAYPPPVAFPSALPSSASAPQTCREYQATATIDGRPQRVYGTACRQSDGSWRIISQQGQ